MPLSRLARLSGLASFALAVAACSSDGGGVTTTQGSSQPTLPPSSCDPGTMPRLADGTCVPVGPTACAEGFDVDPSGWGCRAILATSVCPAGKKLALGSATCVPVDDCSEIFPPVGADVVITPGGATTLANAIATVKTGGTIAIDAGDYDLDGIVKRDVTVIGRCASKVTLKGTKTVFLVGEGAKLDLRSVSLTAPAGDGLFVTTKGEATLTRVIVSNTQFAVTASREAKVRVVESVLDGSEGTFDPGNHAAAAAIRAGTVTLEDVDVRGYPVALGIYNEGSKVTVSRSVVHYEGPPSEGMLANLGSGGALEITESSFRATKHPLMGLATSNGTPPGTNPGGEGGTVKIARSELLHTGAGPAPYIMLLDGTQADLEDTTIVHQAGVAVYALNADAKFTAKGSVIRVAEPALSFGMEHVAIGAFSGGRAVLESTALIDPVQQGIVVLGEGSGLEMTKSLVSRAAWRASTADGQTEGVGIGIGVVEASTATITESAIVGSEQYGLYAGGGATILATGVFVDGTSTPESGVGGVGVDIDELARVAFVDGIVRGSAGAAFAFHAGGNLVQNSEIVDAPTLFLLGEVKVVKPDAAPAEIAEDVVALVKNRFPALATFSSTDLPSPVVPRPWRVPK